MKRAMVGVLAGTMLLGIGLGVGVAVGSAAVGGGDAIVSGTSTQVQILDVPICQDVRGCLDPTTTAPFPLPGASALVTVPAHSHAVVVVQLVGSLASLVNANAPLQGVCNAPQDGSSEAVTYGITINGAYSGRTYQATGAMSLFPLWTSPRLSAGTYTIAYSLSCPDSGFQNPDSRYNLTAPGAMRVERLKVS